jgi:3-hydroxyisobutyrate dehydrogenase-like beta-hydroxyacid dehydrogenase
MVGGDQDAYKRVEQLLRELGTPTHIGANGQGLVLKLAINISLAVQTLEVFNHPFAHAVARGTSDMRR